MTSVASIQSVACLKELEQITMQIQRQQYTYIQPRTSLTMYTTATLSNSSSMLCKDVDLIETLPTAFKFTNTSISLHSKGW